MGRGGGVEGDALWCLDAPAWDCRPAAAAAAAFGLVMRPTTPAH